jgi:hypothetical protein
MKASQAMLGLRNGSIADDGARLWSWFSSVQAATHHEHGDRTRTDHDSGWDVSVARCSGRPPRLGNFLPLRKATADYAD